MRNIISSSLGVGLVCLIALSLVSCASSGSDANRAPAGNPLSPNAVHMDSSRFTTPRVTLRAGERLTLVADTFAPHIIASGTWVNGSAQCRVEPGAPEINDVMIEGNKSDSLGPFPQPGNYNLYCTIHPGMNLSVSVAQG